MLQWQISDSLILLSKWDYLIEQEVWKFYSIPLRSKIPISNVGLHVFM